VSTPHRISPALAAELGWTRVDPRPWGKVTARWEHRGGWRLEHCGHPTALRPWILTAPDGREVRTGVWVGMSREHGTTWERLARAMIWVAGHEDDAAYGGRPGAVVERRDPGPMWARP